MGVVGSGLVVHPWALYFCIIFLSCYVVLDLLANHSGLTFPALINCSSLLLTSREQENAIREPAVCSTLQGHLDVNLTHPPVGHSSKADPWKQMKWTGHAATCRVKGHLIEKLDPALNFRRGFALKFAGDVEDKTHVLPWLLATRVDLNSRKRRVLLDLGANAFSTSITWFLRMYPCDFTEVHAFEVDEHLLRKPVKGFAEDANRARPNEWAVMVKEVPRAPAWMLTRIHVYNQFVSHYDDLARQRINITRFIKDELRLRREDAVVVKMDIEGSEWPILQRWMEDADMAAIVDELFVEVHYDHPSMRGYHWARFAPTKREQAHTLLAQLRLHGFFAHAWP